MLLLLALACGTALDSGGPTLPNADVDADGYPATAYGGSDCDDDDASIHPGADDPVGDGVDSDCDGVDGPDRDGDGVADVASGGTDCDDDDPGRAPGLVDDSVDGVDQDCDGIDGPDLDGDGHAAESAGGDDCDDTDPTVNPGAPEVCFDGVDDDCSGAADEGCDTPVVVSLDDAHARWLGDGEGHRLGFQVAMVGDVNGDGHQDLTAAAHKSTGPKDETGAVYLVTGPVAPGTDGLVGDGAAAETRGPAPFSTFGFSLAGAGDVTGDGLDDMLVGSVEEDVSGEDTFEGAAWLVPGPWPTGASVVEGTRFFPPNSNAFLGYDVDGGADVTGDGVPDLVLGAPASYVLNDINFYTGPGAAWVVEGPVADGGDVNLGVEAMASVQGVGAYDAAGQAVNLVGDLDGDGVGDLAVGAFGFAPEGVGGQHCLVLGPLAGTSSMDDAEVCVQTGVVGDGLGWASTRAGDLDGDGKHDAVFGARGGENGLGGSSPAEGRVYVLVHVPSGRPFADDVADAVLHEEQEGSLAGGALSPAGDLDRDGRAELHVAAQNWGSSKGDTPRGTTYVVFGPPAGHMELAASRVILRAQTAASRDSAGVGIGGGADVTGDGLPDLLVGAYRAAYSAPVSGAAYLVSSEQLHW